MTQRKAKRNRWVIIQQMMTLQRGCEMNSVSKEEATLQERVGRIEKQNRYLKSCMVVLVLSFLALVVMGAKTGPGDGQFRLITAEGISIVDGAGKERILIGSAKEGTGIRILNKAGKRAVGLGVTGDEGGSGILVADKEGRPRIGLGMDEGVPSVALTNENGKKILAFGGDDRGYGFVVMDENEVERVGMGFKKGSSGVLLYNDKGQYVSGMIREPNGAHYFSYVDENGKEVFMR
jgi:hypothetical protein